MDKACDKSKIEFILDKAEFCLKIYGGGEMILHNFYLMSPEGLTGGAGLKTLGYGIVKEHAKAGS